jgi:hypothetical protein
VEEGLEEGKRTDVKEVRRGRERGDVVPPRSSLQSYLSFLKSEKLSHFFVASCKTDTERQKKAGRQAEERDSNMQGRMDG